MWFAFVELQWLVTRDMAVLATGMLQDRTDGFKQLLRFCSEREASLPTADGDQIIFH
jgi:hypothetical protein